MLIFKGKETVYVFYTVPTMGGIASYANQVNHPRNLIEYFF